MIPVTMSLPDWAYVEKPVTRGRIKASPEDFVVEEVAGFELTGSGEHLYLFVEKRGLNTQELVKLLAGRLNLHPKHIAYAGLKDKQAISRQWISICTSRGVDVAKLASPGFRVLESKRHTTKLRRGSHRGNRFEIVIRDLSGIDDLEAAIERVQGQGVPNYFGAQRFGHGAKNIDKARALFAGEIKVERYLRGMYLSAARSFLFNQVLSARVSQKIWATGLPGENFMLDGSNSFFKTDEMDAILRERLASFDIHPSAPLWGKGAISSSGEAFELESGIMAAHPDLTAGLETSGLRQQRRATRLVVQDVRRSWIDDTSLKLSFQLSRGNFATTVLRELFIIDALSY